MGDSESIATGTPVDASTFTPLAVGEHELNAASAVLMTAANVLLAKLPQATTHLPALLAEAVKVADSFVSLAEARGVAAQREHETKILRERVKAFSSAPQAIKVHT